MLYDNKNLTLIESVGPAGGWIFYDKGYVSDGWRYLEAAPSDISGEYKWGNDGELGTQTGIGTGKSNTEKISKTRDGKTTAAKACLDYTLNGYDDLYRA